MPSGWPIVNRSIFRPRKPSTLKPFWRPEQRARALRGFIDAVGGKRPVVLHAG